MLKLEKGVKYTKHISVEIYENFEKKYNNLWWKIAYSNCLIYDSKFVSVPIFINVITPTHFCILQGAREIDDVCHVIWQMLLFSFAWDLYFLAQT